jgi:hypothetical protein
MSVNKTDKRDRPEIRHSVAGDNRLNLVSKLTMPKQPTARLKIINGRPYYYAIQYLWDKQKQKCHQINRYLGKELPKGYRLVK